METTTQLPNSNDYNPSTNPWRISDGKLRRGKPGTAQEEVRDAICGRLKGVYVKEGVGVDGPYQYAVAILQTGDIGEQVVHASTSSKTSSGSFMEGLLECAAGDVIAVEPRKGAERTSNGRTYTPTYGNISKLKNGAYVRVDRREAYTPMEEVLEEFRKHPSTLERKHQAEDPVDPFADTPGDNWDSFSNYVMERQWPAVEIYGEAWSAVLTKLGVDHNAQKGEIDGENWEKLVPLLDQMDKAPASVQKAVGSKPAKEKTAALDPNDL